MLELLATGIILGLSAGLAPLISDLPIILATLFLLGKLSDAQPVLGAISLAGALFLLYMGHGSLTATGLAAPASTQPARSLVKGVLANTLNPHPYLFWLSVGGAYLTKAMALGLAAPMLFLAGFYGCLVGSKVLLAVLVGRSRSRCCRGCFACSGCCCGCWPLA